MIPKDETFVFDYLRLQSFCKLKETLISAPIMQPLNWNLPFEIMYSASDYDVEGVLEQRKHNKVHASYYAS